MIIAMKYPNGVFQLNGNLEEGESENVNRNGQKLNP